MEQKPIYEELEQWIKDEEKFRFLTENIADMVWILDLTLKTNYVNPAIEKVLGFKPDERLKQNTEDIMTAESLERVQAKLLDEFQREKEEGVDPDRTITMDVEYYHKDGSIVLTENKVKGIRNSSGQIIGILGVSRDITKRKQAELMLRESETKFRCLFDLSPLAIAVTDIKTGQLIDVNDKFCQLTKYNKEEVLGKTTTELEFYSKKDRELFINNLQLSGKVNGLEMDFKTKDGSILNSEMFARKFQLQGKDVIFTVFLDRTEYKMLQSKLANVRKMESLGLLAGGVAHDLNNILSGIISYPELLLMELPEDSRFRKPLQTIQESGNRAAAIVEDLLSIARGVAISREPLNINNVIKGYLNSPEFEKLKKYNFAINFKTALNMELFKINGSSIHIRKAVMNLVSNASEAVEAGGNVTISTMNRYIDRPLKRYDHVDKGEYVVLTVADDGPGISTEDLDRIFEPFFTKKKMGRSGTGLGLAVVWNVVQDHEGYIDVISDKNGTAFELYFPITRNEILEKKLTLNVEDYKGQGEKILIVDDVRSQREISYRMLKMLGYKPESVDSGENAVEYLKKNKVDLILLDMIMDPGISGVETYKRILKMYPKQKAIIISGFAETDDVKEAQNIGAGQYVKKPFTIEKLGQAVKDELKK